MEVFISLFFFNVFFLDLCVFPFIFLHLLDARPSRANRSDLEDQEDANAESEEDETNEMTLSTGESLLGLPSAQPSPFSKQRRIHKGHNPRDESSN